MPCACTVIAELAADRRALVYLSSRDEAPAMRKRPEELLVDPVHDCGAEEQSRFSSLAHS